MTKTAIPLTPFHFNEGTLQLPASWKDLSVLVLSAADNDSSGISFTISRDIIPWGMKFQDFAAREIASLSRQLKDYAELSRETGELLEKETVTAEFSWTSPQGKIHQLMTVLDLAPKALILTATVPGAMNEEQKVMLQELIHSLTLRKKEPDTTA